MILLLVYWSLRWKVHCSKVRFTYKSNRLVNQTHTSAFGTFATIRLNRILLNSSDKSSKDLITIKASYFTTAEDYNYTQTLLTIRLQPNRFFDIINKQRVKTFMKFTLISLFHCIAITIQQRKNFIYYP